MCCTSNLIGAESFCISLSINTKRQIAKQQINLQRVKDDAWSIPAMAKERQGMITILCLITHSRKPQTYH